MGPYKHDAECGMPDSLEYIQNDSIFAKDTRGKMSLEDRRVFTLGRENGRSMKKEYDLKAFTEVRIQFVKNSVSCTFMICTICYDIVRCFTVYCILHCDIVMHIILQ